MRRSAAVLLGGLWLAILPSVSPAETIRVAVLVDQPALRIDGTGPVVVRSVLGRELLRLSPPLEISPGADGLELNRKGTGAAELLLDPESATMVVNGTAVSGPVRIQQRRGGLLVLQEPDLEEYLKGVVPLEISVKWHPEALKVQAVVARTYALYKRELNRENDYDLLATEADQVYGGLSAQDPVSNRAVAETRGRVLTYNGSLILAAYHSTSAGPTEEAKSVWGVDLPYLKGVTCPFDRASPRYAWTREIPLDRLRQRLAGSGHPVGEISTVTPFDWTLTGRVARVRLLHSEGEILLRGDDLRRIVGYSELPSTLFTLEQHGSILKFDGRGSGHGVGLCQWGAKEMAELGYSFDRILKYYYPGVEVAAHPDPAAGGPAP
jgi:stage II sporulation protein D